jgi:hypothetical protein
MSRALYISAILLFLMTSCTKDVEAPKGAKGIAGHNATNTVVFFSVPSASWSVGANSLTWEATVSEPQITQDMVDHGIIKVYMQRSTSWWELPYTENREAHTQFGVQAGKLHFIRSESHGAAEKPDDHSFKLVMTSTAPQ